MLAECIHDDIREGDVTSSRFALGLLEPTPCPRFLDRLAHHQDLAVEIDMAPAQCKNFTTAHSGKQGHYHLRIDDLTAHLIDNAAHLLAVQNDDFISLDPWRLFNGGDITDD